MSEIANAVFFGCNYNDKKIKNQFDSLKRRIEKDTALSCIVLDKRGGRSAKDLWKEIRAAIEQSAACIFDVTGFRPNVVLELGYALSIKAEEQIFITFRKRRSKGKIPQWLLSDIGHLHREEYIHIKDLEEHIKKELQDIPYGKRFKEFTGRCEETNAAERYKSKGLQILQAIRDDGSKTDQQLKLLMTGTACRFTKMTKMLKTTKLITRTVGRYGKFAIAK